MFKLDRLLGLIRMGYIWIDKDFNFFIEMF